MAEVEDHWDIPYSNHSWDDERTRFLRLHCPRQTPEGGSHGTVVVLHGGYWKNQFGLDDAYGNAGTKSIAPFFLERGYGAVEVEYSRRDHPGGGWPGTNDDILTAIRFLSELQSEGCAWMNQSAGLAEACRALHSKKLILVGHSAGGCLALWAAHHLVAAEPQRNLLVLACAPVADLVRGHQMKVSDDGDAVPLYMKCTPDESPEAYAAASPAALLPVTFEAIVAYGDSDKDVPPDLIQAYAKAAKDGSPELVEEVVVPGADHFDVVNVESAAWKDVIAPAVAAAVKRCFGEAAGGALL